LACYPEFPCFHGFWGLFGGFLGDSWGIKGHLKGSEATGWIRGISAVCAGFSLFFVLVFAGFLGPPPLLTLYII
jgi:hypothetical protein